MIVDWRDAHFDFDAATPPQDYVVRTVGFLLSEGETFLSVASEQIPDGHRATTHIPVVCVLDITYLEPSPVVHPDPDPEGVAA